MRIAQCWDDGVVQDIRLIEILRLHGAKASFNLNAGKHETVRGANGKLALSELTSVYEGFLVANHTLTHPHLTRIAPDEAAREIRAGRDSLEQIFGYPVKGFAYPFGDHNEAVQELVREAGHTYARTCATTDCLLPAADPMALPANCHFLAEDFWQKFAAVRAADGVFYFWGHSYELTTDAAWQDFEAKIRRLSAAGHWADLPDLFPG